MTLTENFICNTIQLDSGAEVIYGSDEIFDTYPCRFPTIEFQIMATDALVEIADRIRIEKDFKPMHPRDGRTDGVDNDGWYDFYLGVSKLPGENQDCRLDNCITFIVVNSDSDDNEEMYEISLTDDERSVVYEILNAQCRRYHGKDIAAMLVEAKKEMTNTE